MQALEDIYFSKIAPLFPIVHKSHLLETRYNKSITTVLEQAICVATCGSKEARRHLRLYDDIGLVSSPKAFARKLSGTIRLAIELGTVTDMVVKCQLYAILSMFTQNIYGGDMSSQFCVLAVHHAQPAGLHLPRKSGGSRSKEHETLFCCIWVLDRLNAAFHGRPVWIHERDVGRYPSQAIKNQEVAFQPFGRLTGLLDKTIDL